MIKIFKRKNPNLKGEEFINEAFINMLFESIVYNNPYRFQNALIYKNIGNSYCEDCSDENTPKYYLDCKCENYLDDYDIHTNNNTTGPDLINAVKKQFKYLSFSKLMFFKSKLINLDRSARNIKISE